MNREFNLQSKSLRSVFACAAVFATLTLTASLDLLSRHYGAQVEFAAAAKSINIAYSAR